MFVALSPAYSVRNEENASFLTRVVTIIDASNDSFTTFCKTFLKLPLHLQR